MSEFNVYADVDREAMHDRDPRDIDPDERPSRESVADLEPRAPFTPHPREVKIDGWTYVLPEGADATRPKRTTGADIERSRP
jgi:hypothetical protein